MLIPTIIILDHMSQAGDISAAMLSITSEPSAALVTIVATNTFLPNLECDIT